MSYNLSVVLLIPDAYREAINQLAEYMGYGPDNLSVPLEDAQGDKWWGCRTGANPTFLSDFGAVLNPEVPEGEEPPEPNPAALALVMDFQEGGDAAEHFARIIAENNLSRIELNTQNL